MVFFPFWFPPDGGRIYFLILRYIQKEDSSGSGDPVFRGCKSVFLSECAAEYAYTGKACFKAYIFHGETGCLQQVFCRVYAEIAYIFVGCKSGFPSENPDKMILTQSGAGSQFLNRKILCIMFLNIRYYILCDARVVGCGRN